MKYETQICWFSNLQTFTGKIFITFFLTWITQLALAQLQEDFSDGDFTSLPPWSGNESRFVVVGNQLKLNAPKEEGTAYLSTHSATAQNASWVFKVSMAFNPSSSNYAHVYLIADQANLSESLNGYFVAIGENKDEISLHKQTGTTSLKIIDGSDGILDLSTIEVTIRVTRDETGWQLFTDLGSTGNYTREGFSEDDTVMESKYLGILCKYTSTRSDKFFFDDFSVQENITKDEQPPVLVRLEATSSNDLELTFSEPLDPEAATKPQNYVVNQPTGKPVTAMLNPDQKTVLLNFENSFSENVSSSITISGIKDLAGNVIETAAMEFIFIPMVRADRKDLIITEIFADPSPSVGLPESEFVEIYNRSETAFNLSDWKFTDQSSVATLPDFILLPQEYVLLTAEGDGFSSAGKILPLKDFPTLNNSSDVLLLIDANDVTIDSVKYFDTWYKDEDKSNGGWTLEIIDPNNVCSEYENWVASEDGQGGTPGIQNSVFANKPDLTGPKLLYTIPISSSLIQLQFDEKLEKQFTSSLSFVINPSLSVNTVSFSNSALTELQLSLVQNIQIGVTYSIKTENLYDCAGNLIRQENSTTEFGLPEEADSLDILVNEILFNPKPTGADFVEIINASKKFINLKNWSLANLEDGILKNQVSLTAENFLLKPGGILAITESPDILKGEYLLSQEQFLFQINELPDFNDDQGSVAIINPNGNVIDYFQYTDDLHSIFIKDDEGVSLERIANQNAVNMQNWKSASSSVGFATPGYLNSNAVPEAIVSEAVKVEPEIFNPLAGQPDFTLIRYNFEQGGYVANVRLFDSQGHIIKEIANNDVLGTTGFYRWDGDRDDGTKASVGYYMIWFEIFDDHGLIQTFRKRIAIAASF